MSEKNTKEPKIDHASLEMSYYPHIQGADLNAWIHRAHRVKNYTNITKSSALRLIDKV